MGVKMSLQPFIIKDGIQSAPVDNFGFNCLIASAISVVSTLIPVKKSWQFVLTS